MKKVIALLIALGLTSVFASEAKTEENAAAKAEKNDTKAEKKAKKAKKAKKEAGAAEAEKNATK